MDYVIGNNNRVAIEYNGKLMGVNDFTPPFTVQNKSWRGLAFIYKNCIWSDGEHIYYSDSTPDRQKMLDATTNTWIDKEWTVYNDNTSMWRMIQPHGDCVWTDGDNFYISDGVYGNQLVLDKETSTWYTKTWYGIDTLMLDEQFIWSDGENVYFSVGAQQYVLDKATSTWSIKTWNGFSDIMGDHIWSDGTNIFYSENDYQYVLNKSTSTWTYKSWSGQKPTNPKYIWQCGNDFYLTYGNSNYKLNNSHNGWTSVNFSGYARYLIDGRNVWNIGNKCYYSYAYQQYEFNPESNLSWDVIYWNGMDVLHGDDVWTDGEHVYYSSEISAMEYVHLVLDKSTSTWSRKTFNGKQLDGRNVWYEGENVYWSHGNYSKQYVFDKSSSVWRQKTWNGLPSDYQIYKFNLWSDLTHICYGSYVLDPSTSTWIQRTMTGLPSPEEYWFEGRFVWNDGVHVFYSDNSGIDIENVQLVLDLTTMNWSEKEWGGIPRPSGVYVWNYDGDTYYINPLNNSRTRGQFVLGSNASTWYPIDLGITFSNKDVWTDGDKYYIGPNYVIESLNP